MNKLIGQYFTSFLILITLLTACRSRVKELPKAYDGFPIDTTISVIADLPKIVDESSGIAKWNGSIWTHNDSGKQAALFEINPQNGALKRKVKIEPVINIDWEELTQDEAFFYVGDFGNNKGNRKNLKILKIKKQDILEAEHVTQVDTILFHYPDQTNFDGPIHGHNFDCEAMIALGDSLYLFSKNFADQQTRLYSLPKLAGEYAATLQGRFDVKGTITGAAINEDSSTVALSGYYYKKGTFYPFIWLFWDYPTQSFFQGKHQRLNMDFTAQVEGICYDKDNQFIFSSEAASFSKGQLFRLNASRWVGK